MAEQNIKIGLNVDTTPIGRMKKALDEAKDGAIGVAGAMGLMLSERGFTRCNPNSLG